MSLPGTPTNCTLTISEESMTVTLYWVAPQDTITSYLITLMIPNGDTLTYYIPFGITEYTIQNLQANVEYQATIKSYISDDITNGIEPRYSSEASFPSFTLQSQPPSIPIGGGYMYISESSVSMAWGAPVNNGGLPITNYLLTLTPSIGLPTTHSVDASSNSFIVENLQTGVNIGATVKASNDNGSTYGPELTLPTIIPIVIPTSPPASAQAIGIAPGIIDVSWTASVIAPEGSGYYMVLSVSSNPNDPIIGHGTADLTVTSCRLTELNPQSEYYFNIKIINPIGNSPDAITNTVLPTENL